MTLDTAYARFRKSGYSALESIRSARILLRWQDAENDGLVRVVADPEIDGYFDVYGEPEGYVDQFGHRISADKARADIERQIDLNGLWIVSSQARNPQTGEWEDIDSIGMNCGYSDPCSPFENCYVPDLMSAALDYAESSFVGV